MIKTRIEEGLDSLIEMYTIEIEDDTEFSGSQRKTCAML